MTGLHQWGAVTLFHGLPSDRVHAIAQASDGTMWFGTEGGLAKFDGRRTQAVTDSELPTARVLALQADQDGSLWIGTDNSAARLANGKFAQIKELAGKSINAIITPQRGLALMATEQGMIFECRAKPDGGVDVKPLLDHPLQSADAEHPGLLPLTSLTIARDKLLAGSSSRGVLVVENGAASVVQAKPQVYFVRALETDAKGRLWVGARGRKDESGFYEGDDATRITRLDAATGTVMALRAGADNDVWAGTDGRGVFHFGGAKKIERFTFDGTLGGLRSDHVYSIFVDREEVVWFGTDRGVSRYDPHAPRIEMTGDNPESNFVRTLYQLSDSRVLAGTNRGLFVYSDVTRAWQPVRDLVRSIIYAIAEDKNGRLLIGSAGGLYVAPKPARGAKLEEQTFTRIEAGAGNADANGSVRSIIQFKGATYIASFGRGVERVEDTRTRLVSPADAAATREVISLFADEARLLIGTTNEGVFVFDGQQVKSDPAFAILKGTAVRSIDRTRDGAVWFATGRGVYLCKPGADCVNIAPGYDARLVVAQPGANADRALCATTGSGLLRILVDEHLGPVVSQLDVEQGLPSQNVFALLTQQDARGNELLLIGTSRGVARYDPGHVAPSLSPTRIISKRVHTADELRAGLKLEYPQNSLLIDVTATSSRTFPEQFQYAFVLTDDKGKTIKQRLSHESQFAMEGLKPGKYKVTARAFTKDLIPSSPLSFEFTVAGAPFPWTSTALAVLLALALLALLWAILEHRRIARTSAALVDANRELAGARLDLANEAERERRRIARDLHDQTLADLRRLLLVADRIPGGGAGNYRTGSDSDRPVNDVPFDAAAFRKEIESVSNEIRRICEDLSPSVLDNVGLAAALEWALGNAVAYLPAKKKFEYEVIDGEEIEERIKLESGERIQIYRIAQEVINNICRHAEATHVWLSLKATDQGNLILTIEDDGEFFAPNNTLAQGRGLANINARASLIGAEVSWIERDGGGTVFTLRKNE
jgi:signal transduction histidine kinase/ligand-binding sensor domain-containing protein